MPTVFTQRLLDEDLTFPEFVMSCAWAIDYLYSVPHDSNHDPLPERIEPSSYLKGRLELVRSDLDKIAHLDAIEQEAYGQRLKEKMLQDARETLQRFQWENARFETMLQKVIVWDPSGDEYQGLKRMMIEQLEGSIHETDHIERHIERLKVEEPIAYFWSYRDELECEVARLKIEIEADQKRCAAATRWVAGLRQALSGL